MKKRITSHEDENNFGYVDAHGNLRFDISADTMHCLLNQLYANFAAQQILMCVDNLGELTRWDAYRLRDAVEMLAQPLEDGISYQQLMALYTSRPAFICTKKEP